MKGQEKRLLFPTSVVSPTLGDVSASAALSSRLFSLSTT